MENERNELTAYVQAPHARRLDPNEFPHQPTRSGGSAPATIENMDHLLTKLDISARFNSVKKRAELIGPDGYVTMTEVISVCVLNGMSTGHVHEFVELLAERKPYNPVKDWILSEPWDGVDRLEDLSNTIWAAEDYPDDLKVTLIKRWLLSATKAALAEGEFRARGVLTLQGAQGLGKTTWFASLVPEAKLRKEYLLLDHHMDGSNKDSIINAITHWMVEIGELDSSFKKDVARLKGFLTNNCDKLRRPYGRTVAEYPRRTVFAATVNEDRFLVDSTGNSRWWTIAVRGIQYKHDVNMQQVFAQLAVSLDQGEQWWLTKQEDRQLAEYNLRHRAVSAVSERVAGCINLEAAGEAPYRTAIEVLEKAGIDRPTNAQCRECGSILRELFGPPKRVQGRDQWRVPIRGLNGFEEF